MDFVISLSNCHGSLNYSNFVQVTRNSCVRNDLSNEPTKFGTKWQWLRRHVLYRTAYELCDQWQMHANTTNK
jgi:hypothetical protein